MGVKIYLHEYMRTATGNKDVVEVDGNNIRECITDLVRRFPGLKREFFNKYGRLSNRILIDVNVLRDFRETAENPYPEDKPVLDGDELYIGVAI